jgi:ribonuclease-3
MMSKLEQKRQEKLEGLLRQLQIEEKVDLLLLNRAFTHPSFLFEGKSFAGAHNQRLEFLGDAVVGLVVAEHLYARFPEKTEGELTKMRAAIVCETSLVQAARALDFGNYLLMGRGEEQMGGASRDSNLADCFEAVIAAIYLSLGLEKVRTIILRVLQSTIENATKGDFGDHKTKLQEYIQKDPQSSLQYKILKEEGPDHAKKFWAAVYLNDTELACGSGKTKKEAEQSAAREALLKLGVS